MRNSDFLKILENFPGKMELKRLTIGSFSPELFNVDFDEINVKLHRNIIPLKIPKNEEIWFKFLAFMVIFADCKDAPYTEEFLDKKSEQIAEKICVKFNGIFYGDEDVIWDVGFIEPPELIKFANAEEPLF